jgi:MFS family permease
MMESSAQARRVAPADLDPRRWQALALLCGAFFMVLLDGTITLVALPSIGASLGFAKQDLQWVLSAYALTFGGLLLLGGRAADLLGRRRVFMAGVLVFAAASLLCGLAWSPGALLAARVVQGAGAAIMTPTALSIISTTFTEQCAPDPQRLVPLGANGTMNAVSLPAALRFNSTVAAGELARFGEAIGCASPIARVSDLAALAGSSRLRDYKVPSQDLPGLAQGIAERPAAKANPRPAPPDLVLELLEEIW